jgi:hypothetical protein
MLLRCTRQIMGHSNHMVDYNKRIAKAIAQWQVCQVIKSNCVPRYGWNMQRVNNRNHMWLSLSSSTHDSTLRKVFHILANSCPPKSVERFSKSAITPCDQLTNCRALQRSISVGARSFRDTQAIETPKVHRSGFNPAVFCPLTLVPINKVLGVPLANATNDLKAQP